ncbi:MAG: hypothetical protein DRP11_00050 [Candidatus Aenigmatarchaeota archaeon]|nr:MAG: hypothetical protein DRP11_00050 [Candidatus Aenigmarchaeota archaeon]
MRTFNDILGDDDLLEFTLQARVDFGFFARRVLGLNIKWFHEEWVKLFLENERTLIYAPRGFGKSTILGVAFPLWMSCFNKNLDFLIVSNVYSQATDIITKIRNYIESNEYLYHLKPEFASKVWRRTELQTTTGCNIVSRPYSPNVRGRHFNYCILDEASLDRYARDKSIYYSAIAPTVIRRRGHIVLIGTPRSKLDLMEELKKHPDYVVKTYPAIRNGKALWPEVFGRKYLMEKKRELGEIPFNKEYLLNLIADQIYLFPPSLIEPAFRDDKIMTIFKDDEKRYQYFMGLDFALSASPRGDYSVFVVLKKDRETGMMELQYLARYKGMDYKIQEQKVKELAKNFKPVKILADESTFGRIVTQDLKEMGLPVEGYSFHDAQAEYLMTLRSAFERNQLIIPASYKEPYTKRKADILFRELTSMSPVESPRTGRVTYKNVSGHDDTVIALALAVKAATEQKTFLPIVGMA